MGEWYYPIMSAVRIDGNDGDSFYRNRGFSVVRLHRRHNVVMSTEFCCEVPDDNGVDQRICILFQGLLLLQAKKYVP